jgi:polyhydroxyalkanoate synthesis repressor PhaR
MHYSLDRPVLILQNVIGRKTTRSCECASVFQETIMIESANGAPARVKLKKYPNRRYYDTTRSRYVTLEEVYTIIREGKEIEVSDSKSGEDITGKVLAQIILELDPGKLDVFPVRLLHRLIRSNEQLVNDFVERYFNQALSRFMDSQKTIEQSLRQAMGLQSGSALIPDWMTRMWEPLMWPLGANPAGDSAGRDRSAEPPQPPAESQSASAAGDAASTASAPIGGTSAVASAEPAAGEPGAGEISQAQMRQVVAELTDRIAALQAQIPAAPAAKKARRQGAARKAPRQQSSKKRHQRV